MIQFEPKVYLVSIYFGMKKVIVSIFKSLGQKWLSFVLRFFVMNLAKFQDKYIDSVNNSLNPSNLLTH